MMSYDKSDIRFVLSIFENLLLVKKMEKNTFSDNILDQISEYYIVNA